MKNIVVITSSPRKGGNSETLADAFIEGAKGAGHAVEKIAVRDLNLKFCTGCMYCQKNKVCVLGDGMNAIYDKVSSADVLVFATPIYYYAVSGQLKTFLDRLNPLYVRENKFKEVYLLLTCADDNDGAKAGAVSDIEGWISCFDGVKLKGVLCGAGVDGKGEINNTEFVDKARSLGKGV